MLFTEFVTRLQSIDIINFIFQIVQINLVLDVFRSVSLCLRVLTSYRGREVHKMKRIMISHIVIVYFINSFLVLLLSYFFILLCVY